MVQYLYVHAPGEAFAYTSTRGRTEPAALATLYLECAVAQAASLRLRGASCDQILVTNLSDPHDPDVLGRDGVRLIEALERLGVQLRHADYTYRLERALPEYEASRYALDAIRTVTSAAPDEQCLWFADLDCVWIDPQKVFAATPRAPRIACLLMRYPPEWDVMLGTTPTTVGELGRRLGDSVVPAPWIGGELIGGTAASLRGFLAECDRVERELGQLPRELPAEEHLFTILGALGRVAYADLTAVGRRLLTGRHTGPKVAEASNLGFWHLPGEKGLSLRRAAGYVLAGDEERLATILADPRRRLEWFNLSPDLEHRVRDGAWLAANRIRTRLRGRNRKA